MVLPKAFIFNFAIFNALFKRCLIFDQLDPAALHVVILCYCSFTDATMSKFLLVFYLITRQPASFFLMQLIQSMQTILHTIVYLLQILFSIQSFRFEYSLRIRMHGKHLLSKGVGRFESNVSGLGSMTFIYKILNMSQSKSQSRCTFLQNSELSIYFQHSFYSTIISSTFRYFFNNSGLFCLCSSNKTKSNRFKMVL